MKLSFLTYKCNICKQEKIIIKQENYNEPVLCENCNKLMFRIKNKNTPIKRLRGYSDFS